MSVPGSPRGMRLIGLSLLLVGVAAFLGIRSLFLDHWIAVVLFGATGWITAAVYGLIAVGLTGVVLFLSSFLKTRRSVS